MLPASIWPSLLPPIRLAFCVTIFLLIIWLARFCLLLSALTRHRLRLSLLLKLFGLLSLRTHWLEDKRITLWSFKYPFGLGLGL